MIVIEVSICCFSCLLPTELKHRLPEPRRQESARVLTAVTSQVNAFPAHQGTNVRPSGRFTVEAREAERLLGGWDASRPESPVNYII